MHRSRSWPPIIGLAIAVTLVWLRMPAAAQDLPLGGNRYRPQLAFEVLSVGRFVITHELGHLVDFLGLDTFSHQDFQKLFSGSPKWKSCFPLRGQCTPFIEVYADQFGLFSTNAHGVQSGYGDDRLATGSAFANVLHSQWAFRPPQNRNPLAGFGPLAKSFEDSLHSGEDAL